MRRWLPDTIATRTLIVLIVGLAVSHALSMALYFTDRASALILAGGEHVGERMVTITRLVENASQTERSRIVELADNSHFRVASSPEAGVEDVTSLSWESEVLREGLIAHFGNDSGRNFRILYAVAAAIESGNAKETNKAPARGDLILASVQLSDGSWLNFTASVEAPESFWTFRFVLSIGVMLAAVVILSAIVVYHVVAPLRLFARAAERLGVDVDAPPLPEAGPREVRQAARAFNEMQRRIGRFVEDRTQMIAAISHDLRTPLTRMRLRAEFIEGAEQQGKMLHDLDEMEKMISSVLSFARDAAADEPREVVDLTALLQSVCDDAADAGQEVEVKADGRTALSCRPTALRRALTNLIDNAAKYGERARVELEKIDDQIVVCIDDDGPGIPESECEKVFEPFYRIERSRSRETGGVGLGLSVARTIVRAHGGDIEVVNRPEGGLRLRVNLPCEQEA